MNRRLFIGAAAGLILGAPAIVRAESLMRIWTPPRKIVACDSFERAANPVGGEWMDIPVFIDGVPYRTKGGVMTVAEDWLHLGRR